MGPPAGMIVGEVGLRLRRGSGWAAELLGEFESAWRCQLSKKRRELLHKGQWRAKGGY